MLTCLAIVVVAGVLQPTYLRCELQENPVGIGTPTPRFSWLLKETQAQSMDLRQTGYRILVASNPKVLASDRGDLWDSGEVRSSETYGIRYQGETLKSNQKCFWKVRVVDQDGGVSDWSKPASFSVGLLDASDWKAEWIGFDAPLDAMPQDPFKGAKWIWSDSTPLFIKTFVVESAVNSAILNVTVDDQFTCFVNDVEVAKSDGKEDAWRRPQKIDLTKKLQSGENTIRVEATNGKGISGVLLALEITFANGVTKKITSDDSWLVNGNPARVVTEYGGSPWGQFKSSVLVLPPPRILQSEILLSKKVKRATVYGSALGLIELQINQQRVSDELFMPGWTDYTKRVYSCAYDVTKKLRSGKNTLGAILGDGWYAGYVGYGNMREHYGSKPRAKVQLIVEYTDGTEEVFASSRDWMARTGPILESDFLMGEIYDARLENGDAKWSPVNVGSELNPIVEAFPGDPVRPIRVLTAKEITEPTPGTYILNLGQNIAGFARIKVRGKQGQKIQLRFAERLNPDGTFYVTNLRGARATDTYICKGTGDEEWEPRFTFHGFQYIEVTGLPKKPNANEIVGVAITSDTPDAGMISTSSPMLNQLVSNARWTQWMNFIDIPTDCPQRDERLGWTGDAQAYIRTACMLNDVQAFFTKWLISLDDAQRADGQFPMVAPLKVAGGDGGPAWADAGVICPWTIYDVYGDEELLRSHYLPMKKFVDFCVERSPNLLPPKEFHCFGDWVNIGDPTANEVIYEAYFAGSARIVAKAADVLGIRTDARKYEQLYQDVRAKFQETYVKSDGKVGYGKLPESQCGSVIALAFDLVDGELAKRVADGLVAQIEKRGWHLSTGFVGTRDIMHVLSKIGRNDVAFRLLHNTTFPSWGFTIVNGATSIWERWDGWTPEKGFQDPGMNSFAHYAFGAVVGWMMAQPAGITNLDPGFGTVKIAPQIDPNLKWLKSHYDSVRGRIVSEWKISKGQLVMHVVIPPNVKAEIHVPGTFVSASSSLKPSSQDELVSVFKTGSGSYDFVSKL